MKGGMRQRNKGSWEIYYDVGKDPATGKRIRKYKTVKGTKKDAQRVLNEILHQLNTNTYVDSGKMTVKEYLKKWLNDYAKINLAPKTYHRYEEIINLHFIPALGKIQLSKLQPSHIQKHYSDLLKNGRKDGKAGGLSPTTILQHHRILHEALKHAVRWGLVGRNVADAVIPPRKEKVQIEPLDKENVKKLLEAAWDTNIYLPVLLSITTGMRRAEICALQWKDLNFKTGKIAVRYQIQRDEETRELTFVPVKSEKSRRSVDLPSSVLEYLKTVKTEQAKNKLLLGPEYTDNGVIYCWPDGRIVDPDYISKNFRKIANKLGFNKLRFHDLRHTHASLLLADDVHPKIVSERLGHARISFTLDTYSHLLPNLQQQAAEKINATLFGSDGGNLGGKKTELK